MNGRGLGPGRLIHRESYAGKKVYFGEWTGANGKRHLRILGADKRVAERLLEEVIHQRTLAIAGLQIEGAMEERLSALVERYLAELRSYRTPIYVKNTERSLKWVMAALGPIRVRELTVPMLHERRKKRIAQGAALRTANMECAALKTALNWCVKTGLLASNPLQNLTPLKIKEKDRAKRRRALSEEEIGRFLQASEAIDRGRGTWHMRFGRTNGCRLLRSAQPLPQTPLWKLVLTCGLRFGEVASVRWCDLDTEAGVLSLRGGTTKSGKTRQVPIPAHLLGDLIDLRDAQTRNFGHTPSTTAPIFLSPCSASALDNRRTRDLFNKVLARAGIDAVDEQGRSVDIHALRGTAATRMLRHGVNLPIVAEILGHSDVRLTMKHYTDLRINDTKAAVADVPEVRAAATEEPAAVTVAATVSSRRTSS